jgi:7,8-dihydropterin-6-yl-methyl-4-(beta-D-ribofuranosyl)aminobenzene 5'-phosphate synthase
MKKSKKIIITTLVDNCVGVPRYGAGLLGEHGLAFLVEVDDYTILFDTGTGSTIINNLEILKTDLSRVNVIVLSHGHGDHMGGLEHVLQKGGPKPVYVHPDIFLTKAIVADGKVTYSHLKTRSEYEKEGAQFVLREASKEIIDDLWLVGPVERIVPADDVRMPLRHIKTETGLIPDSLREEQFLAIKTPQGLVLVLGCTHNGIINTIEEAVKATGEKRIHTIIGGLHLCEVPRARIQELSLYFKKIDLKQLICNHCVGQEATAEFYHQLGDRLLFNCVGSHISLNI